MKKILIFLCVLLLIQGCFWMYSTRPGTIPPHIKSVAIKETVNSTAEFNLGQKFTELQIQKMQLENLLPIMDETIANSIIYTDIKRLSDAVYTYDETVVVKEYKLTMSLDFKWYDVVNELDMMEKTLSEYEIYYSDTQNSKLSPQDQVNREDALDLLMDKMADKVLIELTSEW
ncbi:MAG: LPS assembly lipoprotein LptE [Candidatus Neomarinimicrobiota bacterium]